jgi:peptidoglycan/LPS O-acetylase OafA/YrhL
MRVTKMSEQSETHKIDDLQHLRGLSILLILFMHLSLSSELIGLFHYKISAPMWLGVEIFFIISGYVIVSALARDRFEPISFFVKRIFRLTPAIVVFLMISALIFSIFLHTSVPDFARHLMSLDMSRSHGISRGGTTVGQTPDEAKQLGTTQATLAVAGAKFLNWKAIETEWTEAAKRSGQPADEAARLAMVARTKAETDWKSDTWYEFAKQSLSVGGGYYLVRHQLYGNPVAYPLSAMWSLSVEDQFYLAIGLICLVASLLFRRYAPAVSRWALVIFAGLLYFLAMAVRLDYAFAGSYWGYYTHTPFYEQFHTAAVAQPTSDGNENRTAAVAFYLLTWRFDFLALGILAAYIDRRYAARFLGWLADRGPFLSVILFVTPLIFGAMIGPEATAPHFHVGWLMLISQWCYLLLVLIAAHNKMLPAARSAGAMVLKYFGNRSYTMYLLHMPLIAATWYIMYMLPTFYDQSRPDSPPITPEIWAWLGKPSTCRYGLVQALLVSVLLLPLTELVYRYVEMPLTSFGRRLAKRTRIIPLPLLANPPAVPALSSPSAVASGR